jgi:hypothetical protein
MNPSEQGIPLAYYEGLDDVHYHFFITMMKKKSLKVVVAAWGHYNDADWSHTMFANVRTSRKPPLSPRPMALAIAIVS